MSITAAVAAVLLYVILKTYALKWDAGDEWIYDYASLLMTEGYFPYRDFFLAHPPFAHLLAAVVFKIFGFSVFTAKVLPIGSAIATAIFVFFVTRKISGAPAAAFALLLLLFTHDWLRVTSHFTGANLATALMMGAVTFRMYRKPAASGLLAVIACVTRFYVGLIGFVLLIEQVLSDRKAGYRMIRSMIVATAVILLFIASGSGIEAPFTQTILYHTSKTTMGGEVGDTLGKILYHNFWLLFLGTIGAALSIFTLFKARAERREPSSGQVLLARLFATIVAFNLFILVIASRLYVFYSIPLFPILAVLGGTLIVETVRWAGEASPRGLPAGRQVGSVWDGRGEASGRAGRLSLWRRAILILVLVSLGYFLRTSLHRSLVYVQRESGQERFYTWIPSSVLPASVDAAIKNTFFVNPRVIGDEVSGITHYLWHESRYWESADAMAEIVQRETSSTDTIFGDSTTTPLIALLSKRRIAGNEIDTNYQRFKSGLTDLEGLLQTLEQTDPPKVLITQPRAGIDALPAFQSYRDQRFREIASFSDGSTGRNFAVWSRTTERP